MTSVWKGLRYCTMNGHGKKSYNVKGALVISLADSMLDQHVQGLWMLMKYAGLIILSMLFAIMTESVFFSSALTVDPVCFCTGFDVSITAEHISSQWSAFWGLLCQKSSFVPRESSFLHLLYFILSAFIICCRCEKEEILTFVSLMLFILKDGLCPYSTFNTLWLVWRVSLLLLRLEENC